MKSCILYLPLHIYCAIDIASGESNVESSADGVCTNCTTGTAMSCNIKPDNIDIESSPSTQDIMNNTNEEEEELGIYSDDDEDAGDLSDDEPPITDQDTCGRPQSQVQLTSFDKLSLLYCHGM